MTEQPLVFRGGPVLTVDPAGTLASAVAVGGGKILAVGGDEAVAPYLADATEVVDLKGRLLLPGFVDAHAHPVVGGLERIRCDLSGAGTIAEYRTLIGRYARTHPGRDWILGGGWSMDAFPGGRPTRRLLDEVVGDRQVCLVNRDHHSSWVTTKTLELHGIGKDTPDPADGRIEREPDGTPTGLLHEGAMHLVRTPPDTQADLDEALREALRYMHSQGVVAWQDAMVTLDDGPNVHEAYLRADREGWLTAKVGAALRWDRSCDQILEQVARLAMVRVLSQGNRYRVTTVKVLQDGVVETFTAAMLTPYLDACGHSTGNHGIGMLAPEVLREVTAALDHAGFQVHYHAIGDRAVRDVLDAVEATGIRSGHRHQIAHVQVVHPDDLPRFHRLGVTANLQALWAAHEPQMDKLTIPFIGPDRAGWQYPFGDLHRLGAPLAMGSDWPVSSADPLAAIHVAVNRLHPGAPAGTPVLGPDQTLPLAVALRAYTAGSAAAAHLDGRSGTIAAGYDADLVLLDRNPFEHPAGEISQTRVIRTYAEGAEVHRAE